MERLYPKPIGKRFTDMPVNRRDDRRNYRRAYVLSNAYEFFIALGAALTGLVFFVDPSSLTGSSVELTTAYTFAVAWSVMYFFGGAITVAGMIYPSLRWEMAGLSLLTAAIMINAVAILFVRGASGYATVFVMIGFAVASGARTWLLTRVLKDHPELGR